VVLVVWAASVADMVLVVAKGLFFDNYTLDVGGRHKKNLYTSKVGNVVFCNNFHSNSKPRPL